MPQRLHTTPPPFAFRIVPPAPLQQRVAAARIAGPESVAALMVERLAGATRCCSGAGGTMRKAKGGGVV